MVILNHANRHYHPLPLTLIHYHQLSSAPTHLQPLPSISTLFQPTRSHVQVTPIYFKSMRSLYRLYHFTAYGYTLYVLLCVLIRQDYLFTLRFFLISVLFSQCLFLSHGLSAQVFQCFHLFDVIRAQTHLGPKKRVFSKFH